MGRASPGAPLTLAQVRRHPLVDAFVRKADEHLAAMGYTEHGYRHVKLVSHIARNVLDRLGLPERQQQLAEIAGYTHDIGNAISRHDHPQAGGVLVTTILYELGMDPDEIAVVAGAVGNHEEGNGEPVNAVSAALILADKTDVHRSRVRNTDVATFDIHDRVNYAVVHSFLDVDAHRRTVDLQLTVETDICQVIEYFEIFLGRMILCRRAAKFLDCQFVLHVNGAKLA